LGLLAKPSVLTPNYDNFNTLETVLAGVFQAILDEQKWLDILTRCPTSIHGDSQDCATWVPNFSSTGSRLKFRHLATNCPNQKCLQRSDVMQPPGILDTMSHAKIIVDKEGREGRALEICAILRGSVGLKNTIRETGASYKSHEDAFNQWLDCMSAADIAGSYQPTGEPVAEALESCVLWELKADPGHARTHSTCYETNTDLDEPDVYRISVLNSPDLRFFVTPEKYIGLGPADLRFDDTIAVLLDCNQPFILRKQHDLSYEHAYSLVGPAYVHGLDVGLILEEAHPVERRSDVVQIRLY
jgi:hypothetical protein